jgi:hypothetical protein
MVAEEERKRELREQEMDKGKSIGVLLPSGIYCTFQKSVWTKEVCKPSL